MEVKTEFGWNCIVNALLVLRIWLELNIPHYVVALVPVFEIVLPSFRKISKSMFTMLGGIRSVWYTTDYIPKPIFIVGLTELKNPGRINTSTVTDKERVTIKQQEWHLGP